MNRWVARLLAIAAGAAAGLAHPPFGVLPGLLGYAVLLWRLEQPSAAPRRSAFATGWLAGLGYFAVSVWWIVEPFLVDARTYAWMAPFAIVLMGGGLALFWGFSALAYRALAPAGIVKPLVFAGVLGGFEWLRGHILTGFPWDLPGETWVAGSPPSQLAAVVGAYGLSWLTLAVAAAPALLILPLRASQRAAGVGAAVLALAGLYAWGDQRLPDETAAGAGPTIRIVQANIDQKDKWKPENLGLVFDAYVALSHRPAAEAPQIVVWPEGALPAVIDELVAAGSPYAKALRDAVAPGQTLLMGVNRVEPAGQGRYRYFNSLMAFRREDQALRITGIYDKHHLVPFGEYMPMGDLAGKIGFRSLVHMPDDFTAGPPPRPLVAAGLPAVQPLICYEALFPGLAAKGARPAWILNISNDAWFGQGSGPWQHLNIASYRAIEQGLPIVRSTPTGVSAVIDAYGRVLPGKRLGLGQEGVIDARLPSALPPTPYSRWGDAGFGAMLALSGLAALIGRRRGRL
jgi:apolipoprotein N-acyltransferase